jgi:8-hydroxy-5-deazaflavin:NADPH oxidoreductase
MKIAVIGTGNVGGALGKALSGAGHDVTYAARDQAKVDATAQDAGADAALSPVDAVKGADVVILAVPFTAIEGLATEIAGAASGKLVVDVTNPIKPDYSGLSTIGGPSGGELVAASLPGANVVKGFNTVFATNQAHPKAHGQVLDALYAADDDAASAEFAKLASSIGFRPVKVGPLSAAAELEAMAWLNIRLQMLAKGTWNSAFVLLAPPTESVA